MACVNVNDPNHTGPQYPVLLTYTTLQYLVTILIVYRTRSVQAAPTVATAGEAPSNQPTGCNNKKMQRMQRKQLRQATPPGTLPHPSGFSQDAECQANEADANATCRWRTNNNSNNTSSTHSSSNRRCRRGDPCTGFRIFKHGYLCLHL